MTEVLPIQCSSCHAHYVLPDGYRQHLEGRAAFCVGCERWWVPVPASSGPAVRLSKGRPERAQIDLRQFRQESPGQPSAPPAAAAPPTSPAAPAPVAPAAPAAAPAAPGPAGQPMAATMRVPIKEAARPNLRVAISVPGTELNRKGVFDLGEKSFLIGQKGCHVNLPKASIPEKAIRIRASSQGFRFEGLGGFRVPVGSMSIDSGEIDRQGSLSLQLTPYLIQLETSATPGRPISHLEPASPPAAPQPAEPQPAAPQPAAPQPAAPQPTAASPTGLPPTGPWPSEPKEAPSVAQQLGIPQQPQYLQGGEPSASTDLRQQVQELAVDERSDQPAFAEQQNAVQEALDGDMTITDLGAQGFQASRFGNPLAGLDLGLVRADGPSQGQVFKITKSPLMIGRREGGMIINDRRVSSKHAQLDIAGARIYTLKDLASTNGTKVNDRPISVGHLQDGDVISFGGVTFEFRAKQVK